MRLLLLTGALALVAASGPVLAGDAPELNAACTAPADAVVLTPAGEGFDESVETPIGALNLTQTQVGDFYVDLGGLPVDTTASLDLLLSFDGLASDYDLVTNGDNALATDNPEAKSVPVGHCEPVSVAIEVFAGTPLDVLDLTADAVLPEADEDA